MIRHPPSSPLFPYTPLFRSEGLPRVGAGPGAAGPRQPDLGAAVGAARHAGAPACGVGLRGVQHFLESVHNVLLHEEPRRLDAAPAMGASSSGTRRPWRAQNVSAQAFAVSAMVATTHAALTPTHV